MKKNRIKEALDTKGAAVGTWILSNSPTACEAAGAAGLDFVVLDMEHGNFGIDSALQMIRACETEGINPLVRVPNRGIEKVKNALDMGAFGIVVPQIRTGEEASQFVNQTRFEPEGKRGVCPWVRGTRYTATDWKEYIVWCNANRMIWAVIETPEAIDNIEDIVSSGLDALVMGPFDLSINMGLKGDTSHPDVIKAFDRVIKVSIGKGVEVCCTLFSSDPNELRKQAISWKKKGVRLFSLPSPGVLLYGVYNSFNEACKTQ